MDWSVNTLISISSSKYPGIIPPEDACIREIDLDRIMVLVEKAERSDIPDINTKYMSPADLNDGQFVYVVEHRIELTAKKALVFFVKNVLPPTERGQAEAACIKEKYPDRISGFVEKAERSDIADISTKFLVPAYLNDGQLVYFSRKRIEYNNGRKAAVIFVRNVLPPTVTMVSATYEENKDEDGFPSENSFGMSRSNKDQGLASSRSLSEIEMERKIEHETVDENIKDITLLSLLIDANRLMENVTVRYISCNSHRITPSTTFPEGFVRRGGIQCKCCSSVLSLADFEKHHNCKSSSKSSLLSCLFLDDGKSIFDLFKAYGCVLLEKYVQPASLKLIRMKDQHDRATLCSICKIGGKVLGCDNCSESYHLYCLGLNDWPKGKWTCPKCRCTVCNSFDAVKCDDILCCDLCEQLFHVECIGSKGLVLLGIRGFGKWFCSDSCSQIHSNLQEMLGAPIVVGGNLLHILKFAQHSSNLDDTAIMNLTLCRATIDVLSSYFPNVEKIVCNEWNSCRKLSYYSCYAMLLESEGTFVGAALFRVFGVEVSELSYFLIRKGLTGRGLGKAFLQTIEKHLSALGMKRVIIPSLLEAIYFWEHVGYTRMSEEDIAKLLQYPLMLCIDTVPYWKSLLIA